LREEEKMMWRMRVVHSTGYAYKSPVTASFNEARLTPRSDSRQNVILNRVETVPASRTYRYTDYWGTAVTAFDLHAPHTELEVTSSSVVETDEGELPKDKVGWDDLHSEAVIDRFDEVLSPTHYTPESKRIQRVGERIAKYHDPQDAVIAAAHWVHGEMDYVRGTTGVHSSGLDALREGKGVCQDFAHLTLILLRGMGIPSRYVSGYLHPKRKAVIGDTIDGQSHAWIQAWTGGWWNYDPTNDSEINEQYISVGVGRDYRDVTPLKGIYTGEGSTDLDVVVEITRLA
jgi:transglutaminase-like putative cysteine protease